MASREELRSALRRALKARAFDPKFCLDLAKALRLTNLNPIADMDLGCWIQQLRQLEPSATAARRARLAAALDRIGLDSSPIAIARRGAGRQAASARQGSTA
jgi:hypothetical protein